MQPTIYDTLEIIITGLIIYSISFNVIQPMWLCRQIQTHEIADMSKCRKQANKQNKKNVGNSVLMR
jgi:hypothetical protein